MFGLIGGLMTGGEGLLIGGDGLIRGDSLGNSLLAEGVSLRLSLLGEVGCSSFSGGYM